MKAAIYAVLALCTQSLAQSASRTIYENLSLIPNLDKMHASINSYEDVVKSLNNTDFRFTLFASTNVGISNRGLSNQTIPYGTLLYHIAKGDINLQSLPKKVETELDGMDDPVMVGLKPTGAKQVLILQNGEANIPEVVYGYMTKAAILETCECSNGIIHVMNTLLLAPTNYAVAYLGYNMTMFVNLTDATGITHDVLESGGYTILAPLDAVLNTTNILSLPVDEKKGFVQYHIIPQVLYSTDFKEQNYTSLQGGQISVTKSNGKIYMNGEEITTLNILMRNGVIHILNGLIRPQTGQGSLITSTEISSTATTESSSTSSSTALTTLSTTTSLTTETTTLSSSESRPLIPPLGSTTALLETVQILASETASPQPPSTMPSNNQFDNVFNQNNIASRSDRLGRNIHFEMVILLIVTVFLFA